jgi:hypothetical protein
VDLLERVHAGGGLALHHRVGPRLKGCGPGTLRVERAAELTM